MHRGSSFIAPESINVLFFGGEFDGSIQERIIGDYKFINSTNSYNRSYISFIYNNGPTGSSPGSGKNDLTNVDNNFTNNGNINAFPNPFDDKVTIQVFDKSIERIEIYNTVGQLVFNKYIDGVLI